MGLNVDPVFRTALTVPLPVDQTAPAALTLEAKPDRFEPGDKRASLDLAQAYTEPLLGASADSAGSSAEHASSVGRPHDVAKMSLADKVTLTAGAGIATAAKDAGGALGTFLKDPKNDALLVGGTVLLAGAQVVPGVDVAVDASLGIVGAAMYASAGPEHRANVTKALGKLQAYAGEVGGAKSQGDLDKASRDFADFIKLGGKEAVDALGTLAGVAAAPAKFAGLLDASRALGGIKGVIAAGSNGLAAGSKAVAALGNAATNVGQRVVQGLDSAAAGLGEALRLHAPLALAGDGRFEARTAPEQVWRPSGGSHTTQAGGSHALDPADGHPAVRASDKTILRGTDPNTLTGLHPDAIYEFAGGYRYVTDGQGRVSEIHATLQAQHGQRSLSLQQAAGGLHRLATDEGGHLIAVRFNGPAHEVNHIAQDIKLNRGEWKILENRWAKELDQGKTVDVKMTLDYPEKSQRPKKLQVEFKVDKGRPEIQRFDNEAK